MATSKRLFVGIVCVLASAACAERAVEPQVGSSAASPGYAERFPTELNLLQRRFTEQERLAKETMGKFSGYPDALEGAAFDHAVDVVKYADQEGRSQAYVDRLERAEMVATFYSEEKDEIRNKVAGAVQYEAKKKNCDAELGGTAAFALDKALEERLEESVHEASDAHALIERNERALGPKNSEALGDQADEIGRTSYLTHIGVVRTKVRLNAMLQELDNVKTTLDRASRDLEKMQSDSRYNEKERTALAEEKVAVSDARRRVDVELSGAKALSERMEERITALQKEYAEALQRLIEALEKRRPASG